MDIHRFTWIFMNFYGFPLILEGSGPECLAAVAACGILKTPVAPCISSLDPTNIKIYRLPPLPPTSKTRGI